MQICRQDPQCLFAKNVVGLIGKVLSYNQIRTVQSSAGAWADDLTMMSVEGTVTAATAGGKQAAGVPTAW